jgi:hypothetical protein
MSDKRNPLACEMTPTEDLVAARYHTVTPISDLAHPLYPGKLKERKVNEVF